MPAANGTALAATQILPGRHLIGYSEPFQAHKGDQGMADTAIWNFRQLAHHELDGFGGIGEGMSIQIAKDGRRILWLAHESAPKNFTAVDVSDPRAPKIVARADLPHTMTAASG